MYETKAEQLKNAAPYSGEVVDIFINARFEFEHLLSRIVF